MKITELHPQENWILSVVAEDGRIGSFDVRPYLKYEAFEDLKDHREFTRVVNGGYFVEWDCGADLSADTIEAGWQVFASTALIEIPATRTGERTRGPLGAPHPSAARRRE